MHNLPRYAPILRRFALVSVSALAFCLVSLPHAAYCSTSIDVSTVTNRYFADYDDFEAFRQDQIADVDQLLLDAYAVSNELSAARSSSLAALLRAQSAQRQVALHQTSQGDSTYLRLATNYLNQTISDTDSAIESCDQSLDDVDGIITDLRAIRSTLDDASLPTYQIVVQEGSGGSGGGGCSCPDYTDILNSIFSRLGNVVTSLGFITTYLEDLYYTLPNFILGFEEGATGSTDWSDLTNGGIEGGILFGRVVSNIWVSASPQTLQSRIMRYTEYVSEEIEPTPHGVASDVPLVAIIGLLYRIQHQQMITNRTMDVYSSKAEEEMDEAKEEAEEAEDQQQQEMGEVDTDLDIDVSADSGILKLWDELQKFLNALEGVLRSSSQSQELIVLAADGISINLGRSSGSAVSRAGRVSVSSPSSGNWSTFCSVVRSICTILWYVLGAIIVYFLTVKVFTIVSTGVTLAIAIAGGDISGAVTLAERFFHKST